VHIEPPPATHWSIGVQLVDVVVGDKGPRIIDASFEPQQLPICRVFEHNTPFPATLYFAAQVLVFVRFLYSVHDFRQFANTKLTANIEDHFTPNTVVL